MTYYASSAVTAFIPVGGVCAGHSLNDEPADPEYPGLSVDCEVCEPILANDRMWSADPESVPLTAQEERRLEREKRQLEVDALANARADQEYLRSKRLAEQKAEADDSKPAAKPASRARKASGASA